MSYRISVDTGGTFTDVVVADAEGRLYVGKGLTTADRSFDGFYAGLNAACDDLGVGAEEVLKKARLLTFGTTRATNAIVTRSVAKTAFLTTEGFPEILVLKEGGKFDPHDFSKDYPEPYIPRRHTFEIPERIDAEGGVAVPLDEQRAREILTGLRDGGFEAIAVTLIWSTANPIHELRLGELIEELVPDVPYTLSHALIPILREYRRASTTAIDASLKPLMGKYLTEMSEDLAVNGFQGELLVSTSVGGAMHVDEVADHPVHTVKSGPAMAPVAGQVYAARENLQEDLIVCDAGGTTFDVGLVRGGELVKTRDTWLGRQWTGDLISMSTVDVRSVGAGGGSIAWVDPGGLLRVGPASAGSDPGPACYGLGGDQPTVTDAAVVLGYLDPDYFNGGRMRLDRDAAMEAVAKVGDGIGKDPMAAAFGIMTIANELMIEAIQEITVIEGIDPQESAIVAGGGAAGLNILPIARELGCGNVVLPETASALSACGMQFSDIVAEDSSNFVTASDAFDYDGVNGVLRTIGENLEKFRRSIGAAHSAKHRITIQVEAHYRFQVWDLEASVPGDRIDGPRDLARLVEAFHQAHERVFAVRDEGSVVEFLNWRGRLAVELDKPPAYERPAGTPAVPHGERDAFFGGPGPVKTPVYRGLTLPPGTVIEGPAIVEVPTTTLVVYPDMRARVSTNGNFVLAHRKRAAAA